MGAQQSQDLGVNRQRGVRPKSSDPQTFRSTSIDPSTSTSSLHDRKKHVRKRNPSLPESSSRSRSREFLGSGYSESDDNPIPIDNDSNLARRNMGTLLVVNDPNPNISKADLSVNLNSHPVLQRLNEIPNFSPILHQRTIKSVNYGWINERSIAADGKLVHHALEISPYLNIGHFFQSFVHENAHAITVRQTKLTKSIKETDRKLGAIMKSYTERQKVFAKNAEKLNKIHECTKILTKCHATIQSCKHTIQLLNQLLPVDERLEPFVWGEDNIELRQLK